MRHPASLPTLSLAGGIAAGFFFPFLLQRPALVVVWCAALGAFLARRDLITTICLVTGFALTGAIEGARTSHLALATPLAQLFARHVSAEGAQLPAIVEGRLRSDAIRSPSGVSLNVATDRLSIEGRWHLTSGGALVSIGGVLGANVSEDWRAGRRVRFPVALRRPARHLNQGVPDGEKQYALRGTSLVGFVKSDRLVETIARGDGVSEASAAVRASVRKSVQMSIAPWSVRSAAVVNAILIGDRAGLEQDDERRLQEAGTYHVIAISGGNIAMFGGIVLVILRVLRAGPAVTSLSLIIVLACYARIAEGGVSVARATLMASLYFAARLVDLRPLPLNVLAICGAVLLFENPLQIVDAGFALTFGATLGIIVGMSRFVPAAGQKWLRPVIFLFAASVFAEAALFPIGALFFSRVTVAGLMVNFAAIPLMAVAQSAGIATVLLTLMGSRMALVAGGVAHLGVQGLMGSAALVDLAPWVTWRLPAPSFPVIAVYYVSVIGFVVSRTVLRRCVSTVCMTMCALWIVCAPVIRPNRFAQLLRVTFLDVGQGDAALVQFPDGRNLAVDAGGSSGGGFDIGSRVVSPAIWALGVRKLDYLTISHGDLDHIGGVPSVLRDFLPAEIWEGVSVPRHGPMQAIRRAADGAGRPWRTLRPDDKVSFGPVDVFVRHPPVPEWERQRVRNDDSVVLEVRYGSVSFVFTGDIGSDIETGLAGSFEPAPIRIIKVPHHGSASSSSSQFLRALRPDIAIVSCGRGNLFGHPSSAVISRYLGLGAAVFRTDRDGQIVVQTDGAKVQVHTFTGRGLTLRAGRN